MIRIGAVLAHLAPTNAGGRMVRLVIDDNGDTAVLVAPGMPPARPVCPWCAIIVPPDAPTTVRAMLVRDGWELCEPPADLWAEVLATVVRTGADAWRGVAES